MAKYVLQNGSEVRLPKDPLGEGGEAYVYKLGTQVAKIYKEPNDVSFTSLPGSQAQEAASMARERLRVYNDKLRQYPKGLPSFVLSPQELIFDPSGNVKGYMMPLIDNPMTWLQFADPGKRKGNLQNDTMTQMLLLLHTGVTALHQKNVVVGDFNDNNFLCRPGKVFFVDSDAYQLDKYLCRTFTQTFVDPSICVKSPHGNFMLMTGNYSKLTDWYAFCVFVTNTLLCWHPYAGQHKPKPGTPKVDNGIRPLQRLTVISDKEPGKFREDMLVPKFLTDLTLGILTDDLAQHLWQVFNKNKREIFPEILLQELQWTTCTKCGTYHARHQCPSCNLLLRPATKEVARTHGKVYAEQLFQAYGSSILLSVVQNGNLAYLYHDGNKFIRESGAVVMPGKTEPGLKYEICGNATLVGKDRQFFVLTPNAQPTAHSTTVFAGFPIFTANSKYYFWMEDGEIKRNNPTAGGLGADAVVLGKALQDKTLFWTGNDFGFGLYGNASLYYFFVFDTEKRNFNDAVPINFKGEIVDATATFTEDLCWFFVKIKKNPNSTKVTNAVYVVNRKGELVAKLEDSDKHWMNSVRGKAPVGDKCFANTDDGIFKLGFLNGAVYEVEHFVDTEPWGEDFSRLHLAGGLVVNDGKTITRLTMKP